MLNGYHSHRQVTQIRAIIWSGDAMATKKRIQNSFIILLAVFYILASQQLFADQDNLTAFINVALIDGTGAEPVSKMAILVKGIRIFKVGHVSDMTIPLSASRVDLKGATILPGFFNSHVHAAHDERKLKRWSRGGVTTVREMGNALGSHTGLRDRLLKDNRNARLIIAGPIVSNPGGYGTWHVSSPKDAKEKINDLIDKGVDFIKIGIEDRQGLKSWPLINGKLVNAIVETAHSRGKSVSCHVTRSKHLVLALDGGTNSLEHMVYDELSDSMIERVVQEGVFWVPTLELWKNVSEQYGDWILRNAVTNLDRFVKSGGKVVLGTDFAGFNAEFDPGMPITEILLMKQASMTPMQIIVSATRNAAQLAGVIKDLGTIEPGKIADMIVIRGNPLTNIKILGEVKMVIKSGEIIKNEFLDDL